MLAMSRPSILSKLAALFTAQRIECLLGMGIGVERNLMAPLQHFLVECGEIRVAIFQAFPNHEECHLNALIIEDLHHFSG